MSKKRKMKSDMSSFAEKAMMFERTSGFPGSDMAKRAAMQNKMKMKKMRMKKK